MASRLSAALSSLQDHRVGRIASTDVLAGLAVSFLFFVFLGEPQPVDPMIYMGGATSIGSVPPEHRSTRLGVVLPTWAVSQLFGYSELTFYFLPLVSGFILGAAVSYTARQLFDPWVGLAAAALAASSPFVLPFGSQLLPDIPSTATLVAALGLGLAAAKTGERRRISLLVAAGFATGLAYLFRETAILFFPSLVGALAVAGLRIRGLAVVFASAFFAPVLDVVFGFLLWNDPFTRIRSVIDRSATPPEITVEAAERAFSAQENPIETMSLLLELNGRSTIGLVLLVLAAAYVVHATVSKDKDQLRWVLPVWFLLAWLTYGIIGSIEPDSGRPVLRLILGRYWAPFSPALALMAAAWVFGVFRAGRLASSRFPSFVAMTLMLLVAGLGVSHSLTQFRSWFISFGSDSYQHLRTQIADIPPGATVRLPDEIDPVLRLYFNDSFGRPVADVAVTSEPPSPGEGLDDWYLFHAEGDVPEGPTDERRSWPRATAVAETRPPGSLRWVLFAPAAAATSDEREIVEEPVDGAAWRLRLIEDSVWSDEMPVPTSIRLLEDTDAVVYDDVAFYGKPPPDGETIQPGELTEVRIGVDSVDGIFSIDCQYFPIGGAGERVSRRAVTMRHPTPFWGDVVGICLAPTEHESYLFRPVLIVRGPALFSVEGALITAVDVEELER